VTPAEVAQVLAKCSAYDLRTVGRADVAAWSEILGVVDLADALEAVTRHYRESSDRAMPADVLRHSRSAKQDRQRRERVRAPVLALPSRFETDGQRDARIAAHVAAARAAIKPRRDVTDSDDPSALDQLRALTAGPNWPDPSRDGAR
jgi:hypothetical protein